GAVYAALGLGLVLVHRSSGVVNFAHGAMAMLVTYAFVELRPDLGLWPALAASVVAAAALGLVVHVLVFRPLRTAPALARVVASVGLLATLQALAVLWFGADSRPVPSLLPNRPVALLVVPALAAALAGRLSSFGATVAAALGLGMAQSAMLKLQDDVSWIPRAGVREALPLVLIVAALALGAGRSLGRGAPVERPLPL